MTTTSGEPDRIARRAEGGVQHLQTRLPALITMLEGSNEIRRGSLDDAYRAACTPILRWSAADAGITETGRCGLRGSPTIVKKVFAPSARQDKVLQVPVAGLAPDAVASALMAEIFKRRPEIESDLMRFSTGQ